MSSVEAPSRVSFPVTKIRRPVLRAGLVGRGRLEAPLLAELQHGGVVLVSAPGGWGKTVALARALEGLPGGSAVAWVSLDESDDLPRLLACLSAALDPYDLPWRVDPDALASLGAQGGERRIADELLNTLAAADAPHGVLVFDDLHRLQDRAALALLELLAERLPANWTMALATRVDPPLSLARWRGRGLLAEFRQAALAFDASEVQALRDQIAAEDSPDVHDLLARTEGWPAGLRLCLSAARQPAAAGGGRGDVQRPLFDYLAAEVFGTLRAELQRFLLRVSVLPELRASRCAALAQEPRAVQLLEEIERRGLFVSVIDVGDELTLRLHDLFRDFLEERLRRDHPEELPPLLMRAAEVEDDLHRRVLLYLRAGQVAAAEASLLQGAKQLLSGGGAASVLNLVEQFPQARREHSPALAFVAGLAAWPCFEWGAMRRALARAGDGFAAAGQTSLAQQARSLEAMALTALSRLDEAAERVQWVRAQPMSRDTESLIELMAYLHSGAHGAPSAPAAHVMRLVDLLHGQPAESWYFCAPHFLFIGRPGMRRAMEAYVDGAMAAAGERHATLRALAHALQAWLILWQGRVEEAAARLREVQDEDRWLGQPRHLRMTLLSLESAVAAALGDRPACRAAAQAMLDDLNDDPERAATWRGLYLYQCTRLADGMGDEESAQRLWTQLQAQPTDREWPLMPAARATLAARRRLWAGDAQAAAALLQPWLDGGADVDMISSSADLRLTLAAAQLACGRVGPAWQALRPALALVRESGEIMPLQLAGERLLAPLIAADWRGVAAEPELIALLPQLRPAAASVPITAAVQRGDSRSHELSARERQIVERIAAGDSNKLIARAFDLSPHTVKRHVANILDKLGMSSRGQVAAWYHAH